MIHWKEKQLSEGKTFITSEKGNSMMPLINSGQKHKLAPATWKDVEVGDIVFVKVKGRYFTHLVKAKDEQRGCLIGSNRGSINGWSKQVFGKVVEIL